jgi:hypothetical protein
MRTRLAQALYTPYAHLLFFYLYLFPSLIAAAALGISKPAYCLSLTTVVRGESETYVGLIIVRRSKLVSAL